MRTTLTLDSDVATQVEQLRRDRNTPLKAVINEALRRGLREMTAKPGKRKRFRTKTVALGPCLVGSVDDVGGLLAEEDGTRL